MTAPVTRLAVIDETDAVAADVQIRAVLDANAARLVELAARAMARKEAHEEPVIELAHASTEHYLVAALELTMNLRANPQARDFVIDLAAASGYAQLLEGGQMVCDLRKQAALYQAMGSDAAKCVRIRQIASAAEVALTTDHVLVIAYVGTAVGFYRWEQATDPVPTLEAPSD